jgi:hypothetical protein
MLVRDGETYTNISHTKPVRISQLQREIILKLSPHLAISATTVIQATVDAVLQDILNGPYRPTSSLTGQTRVIDEANFELLKTAFNTCMNQDAIKAYGVTPLVALLKELDDKIYPVKGPHPSTGSNEELTKAILWLSHYQVSGLVNSFASVSLHLLRKRPLYARYI